MGKKQKTREQKIIADLRRKVYSLEAQKPTKIIRNMPISTTATITTTTATINSHPYLTEDILKTGVLMGIIVLIQLVLYFLLKNHILTLPGISY